MMLFGGVKQANLEIRNVGNGVRLSGAFPYKSAAELAAGRVEVFSSRAFAARLEAGEDIHLLSGHDYEKPLASRGSGTLELRDSDDALSFEATISVETTWARDFLAAHEAGLIRGLSPGFRIAQGGERITRSGNTVQRNIIAADLFEISAVTRPAYSDAQIQARNWQADHMPNVFNFERWRR